MYDCLPVRRDVAYSHLRPRSLHRLQHGFSFWHLTLDAEQAMQESLNFGCRGAIFVSNVDTSFRRTLYDKTYGCTPSTGLSRSTGPYTRYRKFSTRSTQQLQLSVGTWAIASALREHLFSRLRIDLVSNTLTACRIRGLGASSKLLPYRRINCVRVARSERCT